MTTNETEIELTEEEIQAVKAQKAAAAETQARVEAFSLALQALIEEHGVDLRAVLPYEPQIVFAPRPLTVEEGGE